MMAFLSQLFSTLQDFTFESLVMPMLSALGWVSYLEEAFDFTEWFLIGLLEVLFLALVILPLERLFPAERRGPGGPGDAMRIDITYTLLHRLGAFSIFVFAVLEPAVRVVRDAWQQQGLPGIELDVALGLEYSPLLAASVYLLILDFVDYWIHRFQHRIGWWWALHAIHHSQRRMTVWSDNRNHLLDDLIRDAILAFVALLIGVAPAQYIGFVVFTRIWQSLQHANLGIAFPRWLSLLLVSPGFHRLHHSVAGGHEGPVRGMNFAVLFPMWDWVFRTADWSADACLASGESLQPTGIKDQELGVNYGRGFWEQQWVGVRHLVAALMPGSRKDAS